jgi:hypothetical protein
MAVYDPRGGGNVHIDQILTNISVGFPNNDFVGDVLAPAVPVRKQSDIYYTHGREGWVLEPGSDVRAPGTEASEIPGMTVSTNPYFAIEHALEIAVTDEERENADAPLSPDRDGTELVTSKIMLGRELTIRNIVQSVGNYVSGYSLDLSGSPTLQWDAYATSNPIGDVKTARRKIHGGLFIHPTVGIFPYQVMAALEDHPDFIERIKYSQTAVVTPDLIARLFMIPRIVVPGVGHNTARMGQAESLAYLWGKDVIIAYVPPRPGLKIPAFMYEFVWTFPGGQRQVTERWREQKRVSDMIRVRRRYVHKLIAVDGSGDSFAGYLINEAVTAAFV